MPFYGEYFPEHRPILVSAMTVNSKLKPVREHTTTHVEIERLKLTDLPGVMRNMGWETASKLMDKWFTGERYIMIREDRDTYDDHPLSIPADRYDDTIVTIVWAQKFTRFNTVHKKLIASWRTQKSIDRLKELLEQSSWQEFFEDIQNGESKEKKFVFPFGNTSMTARELNATCQIQTSTFVSDFFDAIDDMYGALGAAMIQLAVTGYVTREKNGRDVFVIENYGTYIKDVYEFNGPQFLGHWSKDKIFGPAEMLGYRQYRALLEESGNFEEIIKLDSLVMSVNNRDFNAWRDLHNRGGDFIIYSDVYWTPADPNEIINLT
jgi:hypothetical protein